MAAATIRDHLPRLLTLARGPALAPALELAKRAQVVIGNDALAAWVADERQDDAARIAALRMLLGRRAPEASVALTTALDSRSDSLVAFALTAHEALDPAGTTARLERVADA
jgi:hypothetical protein